jgi:hypothetical protein
VGGEPWSMCGAAAFYRDQAAARAILELGCHTGTALHIAAVLPLCSCTGSACTGIWNLVGFEKKIRIELIDYIITNSSGL